MIKTVKFLIMDVDGTLTDGKIYMGVNGEVMKAFSVKDGLRIQQLRRWNIEPAIITGRKSEIVMNRAIELGIREVYQEIHDKKEKLLELCKQWGCSLESIAYIGDDDNDLECIKMCGNSGCTADASDIIKINVNYICKHAGGDGAVREYIDYLVKEKENNYEDKKNNYR